MQIYWQIFLFYFVCYKTYFFNIYLYIYIKFKDLNMITILVVLILISFAANIILIFAMIRVNNHVKELDSCIIMLQKQEFDEPYTDNLYKYFNTKKNGSGKRK